MPFQNLKSLHNPNRNDTQVVPYKYDDKGNVKSVVDVQGQETKYEYSNNDLTKIIQNNKAKMTYTYYPNTHNVKTATTEEGLTYSFEYDTYGNNTNVSITGSDGSTISSSADYTDDGNRLEYTQDALGKKTYYGYHADTNVLDWVQYPNDAGSDRKTKYTYDEMYRMSKAETIGQNNLGMYTNYTYDDDNDMLAAIQTPTTTYNFTYGNFGLRTSVSVGTQPLATYKYTNDKNNYLEVLEYGNEDSVLYDYDKLGRLTLQTYEDGDTVKYAYDNNGDLASVVDSGSGITTKYYYDLIGRAMKYTETKSGYSHSVEYTYDTDNNLSAQTEIINGTAHNTTYTYDDDNRVTSKVTDNIGVYYTYDSFGRLTQQVTKNGDTVVLTETYTYNAGSAQIASYSTTKNGSTETINYTYDDNGNITEEYTSSYSIEYVYDSANQLIAEYNSIMEYAWFWTYDNAGNIQSYKKHDYGQGMLGAELASHTYTYGDEQWGDLLKAYDGANITYDNIGNPLTDGTWSYQWEHGRELASMTSSTDTWTFTYNADGIRTKRTNGTRTYEYIYDGSQLVQLNVDGNTLYFTYDAAGVPVSVTYNGNVYYYVTNLQGDVTSIVDASGNTQVYCTYTAFGTRNLFGGSMASTLGLYNPFWYRGYVYDTETGLYYLQSRYYDPEIGRFINADIYVVTDSMILGNNMYSYCYNSPVSLHDPSGSIAWLAIFKVAAIVIGGALAGAGMGVVSNIVTTGLAGQKATKEDIGNAAIIGAINGGLGAAGGAIGSIKQITSVGIAVISGIYTGINTEGSLGQKIVTGGLTGVISGIGAYAGTMIDVDSLSILGSGFASFAATLSVGTPTEITAVISQSLTDILFTPFVSENVENASKNAIHRIQIWPAN